MNESAALSSITDSDVEQLRTELRMLRSSINVDKMQRASKLRARIADLELEASRVRSELYLLVSASARQDNLALEYDTAVSNLVDALYKARGSLSDSNVLMAMQIVAELRKRAGLSE
jgi:hypothetical protein